ncbi:MAG: geranylgeranyl reductase family protein [Anaerolineaceae bacterium]|nr:geranylgeranyl reductase family protein [Anaerolineaceae bacterium]
MKHDVIIVGSGPAGSLAAYYLAKEGLDVLILEKESLPRYKPCGGGLPLKAQQMIPFDCSEALEFQSGGGIVAYAGTPIFRIPTREPFAALVMRDHFDQFLVRQAVGAGAGLIENCAAVGLEVSTNEANVITSEGVLESRAVIGADGVNSIIADLCGLMENRRTGIALEAEVRVSDQILERQGRFATFDFGAISHGYGWVFPKRDHLSVGVFHARPRKVPHLKDALLHTLRSLVDESGYEILRMRGHPIPLGGARTALDHGPAMLVGDAANMADPFFGEGIYYAMWSAKIAAEVLLSAWDQPVLDLTAYTERVEAEILPQFDDAASVAQILYRVPRMSAKLLRRSAFMQEFMFGVISGKHSYRDLYRTITLSAPKIIYEALFHSMEGIER